MLHDHHVQWNKNELKNKDVFFCAITRFNIRIGFDFGSEEDFEEFGLKRLGPFFRFAAPGIRNQKIKFHKWYVLFDSTFAGRIPEIVKDANVPGLVPVVIPTDLNGHPAKIFDYVVQSFVKADCASYEKISVTRFDSDDALSRDYIAVLDDMIAPVVAQYDLPVAINFPYQLRLDFDKLGPYICTDSSTMTVLSKQGQIRTPYEAGHTEISKRFRLVECGTRFPMVLVSRNDSNVGRYAWWDLVALERPVEVIRQHFGIDIGALGGGG